MVEVVHPVSRVAEAVVGGQEIRCAIVGGVVHHASRAGCKPPCTMRATLRFSVAQVAPSGQLTLMLHAPLLPKDPGRPLRRGATR